MNLINFSLSNDNNIIEVLQEVYGKLPLEGVIPFEAIGSKTKYFIAYRSFSKESQIDNRNKLVSIAFSSNEMNKNPFELNTLDKVVFKDELEVHNVSNAKASLDSDEWQAVLLKNVEDQAHYKHMNSDWSNGVPLPLMSIEGLGAFGKVVNNYLNGAQGVRLIDTSLEELDTEEAKLKSLIKKDSSVKNQYKVVQRLIKDFSLDLLKIHVRTYRDSTFNDENSTVFYFFDGFTFVMWEGNYAHRASFDIQKNTPYAVKRMETGVGKEYHVCKSMIDNYDMIKKDVARILDRIQDKWRVSLDDDTEEAVEKELNKTAESHKVHSLRYREMRHFDNDSSEYDILCDQCRRNRGEPLDAQLDYFCPGWNDDKRQEFLAYWDADYEDYVCNDCFNRMVDEFNS